MTRTFLAPPHGEHDRFGPARRAWHGRHRTDLLHGRPGNHPAASPSADGADNSGGNVPARILSGILLLGLLVFWLGTNWLVPLNCRAQPVSFSFGSDTTSAIVVPAGKSCTILVKTGSIAIDELNVERPQSNGVVVPRGRSGVVYLPFTSFKGEDTFAVQFKGHSAFDSGAASLRVTAVVK
jgi:hypothetical protein